MPVRFPIETLHARLAGRRVAVACTPAAWIPQVGSLLDHLPGRCDVRGFLAMEHGLRGELQDGVRFESYTDGRTGIPVFSYFGTTHTFPESFLQDVDVVVFHAQDVSHRAYTYQETLADTLVAAARTGTAVIVLDRPTPLGHLGAQGPVHPQFFPIGLPVIIPLTLGELARALVESARLEVDLTVLPVGGWRRADPWPGTGLPWLPPSPNIPSLASAYAYACTGIVQATNVSEGRGTCNPFEYVGAPWVHGAGLAARLEALGLPGVLFREIYFKPAFNKYASEVCSGVHLVVHEPLRLQPLRTQFAVLQALAQEHPDHFTALPGLGGWLDGREWSAERLRALDIPAAMAEAGVQAAAFMNRVAPSLLY